MSFEPHVGDIWKHKVTFENYNKKVYETNYLLVEQYSLYYFKALCIETQDYEKIYIKSSYDDLVTHQWTQIG